MFFSLWNSWLIVVLKKQKNFSVVKCECKCKVMGVDGYWALSEKPHTDGVDG